MRSLKGWKALVCFATAASLLLAVAPESFAVGKTQSVIDPTAGEVAQKGPRTDDGVEPVGGIYYPRANYVWPFATGPYYGKVSGREAKGPGVVVTAVGSFRLDGGVLPFPNELTVPNKLDRQAAQYFLVQVHPESVNQDRWELLYGKIRDNGGEVIRHMPVAVVLARLTPQAHAALTQTRGLLAIEPYHGAFKLDPTIGRTPLLDPQKAVSDVYTLDISLHRGENAKDVATRIAQMGGNVQNVWSHRIQAELPSTRLRELANLEAVYMVHEKTPIVPWDQQITNTVQTGGINLNANPYHDAGIRGGGLPGDPDDDQVLMVLDNGIQLDAGDLSDTSTSPGSAGASHRKVRFYGTTNPYGGNGDDLGCDVAGGFTHGHMVSSVALGNAAHNDFTFRVLDQNGNPWELTGVAPDAKLAAYDANVTPAVGSCQDTLLGVLDVGTLYDPTPALDSSLEDAYTTHGAKIFNFSWGSQVNTYSANADEVDEFLNDNKDAMVIVAAGNAGQDAPTDGIPDLGSLGEPATTKNGISVGSHGGADDYNDPQNRDERSFFSSTGPAGATGRFAPLLMAPGQERGISGHPIAFSCRTNDNESTGSVICDSVSARAGTSFSAPAVAGAGVLIRDYFALGFHPDATSANSGNEADRVDNISGALVKSVLVSSAEFLGRNYTGTQIAPVDHLTIRSRANNEQGYGRIQLDKALPLGSWADSPTGLLVVDGGIPSGVNDFDGTQLTGSIDATTPTEQTATFEICDDSQELRVALSWVEAPGDALVNDLDLEIEAPDGRLYFGNYFTDDDNGDGFVDPLLENCPTLFDDGSPTDIGVDRSEWSLATCVRPGDGVTPASLPPKDSTNPTEAIYLSPNPEGDLDQDLEPILRGGSCDDGAADPCGYDAQCNGVACLGGTSQVQSGQWTVRVKSKGPGVNATQGYALAIVGGVCSGSSTDFDKTSYVCNDEATIAINERSEASDPAGGLSAAVVAARTTVEVLDSNGTVVDTESGSDLGFVKQDPNSLRFVAEGLPITDGTARDPNNGALDVQDGDTLRVTYADESVGGVGGDPNKVRVATAQVGCQVQVLSTSVFAQFGTDTSFLVVGGCERNARGYFEFGFPDRYMDAQEFIAYRFTFTSIEVDALENTVTELSCVFADADSPAACPASVECDDPNRLNNAACTDMTIVDPVQVIGTVNPNSAISSNYTILMNETISGTPDIEMVLRIEGEATGKTAGATVVNQHRLNVDEVTTRYNTDFPNGGTLFWDRNNNGLIELPTNRGVSGNPGSSNTDYVFEQVLYSDLTQGTNAAGGSVTVNDGINAPWNFDNNDGGFTTGLATGTDDSLIAETIAQWGEDKNFNNKLDGRCQSSASTACDRFPDPINCGFCDSNSTIPGDPCVVDGDCVGGLCDFVCIGLEDRDPENFPQALLDQNWSTDGGCGWQTKAPGTCSLDGTIGCYNDGDCDDSGTCDTGAPQATGGIWHTGRIGGTQEADCGVIGDNPGQCQIYETIGGLSGNLTWFELLVTPELTKVNQELDASGAPVATAEITEFRFNWSVDMPDNNVSTTVEFDTDVERLEPVDLKSDFTVLWTATGDYGAINGGGNPFLTRGWGLFAPINAGTGLSENGTEGNNRVGKNSCYFEGGAIPASNLEFVFAGLPPDDDTNEGYCPSGQGTGGTDAHLLYCSTVCSDNLLLPCASDTACGGTCIGGPGGFCGNAPAAPCDADADCDFGTCVDVACNGTCTAPGTESCSNGKPGVCDNDGDCQEACVFTSAAIDEFVTPNGPVRGVELNDFNGPDMRFSTLEDLFGTTGNKFAGAIGFQNREANDTPEAVTGYGVGVDDVVVEWREFTLEEDATECDTVCVGGASDGQACASNDDCGVGSCGGGSCATINLITNNIYEGNLSVGITVVDFSPSVNDCKTALGDPTAENDTDCDNDSVQDVVVKVDSPQELEGEWVVLNALPGSATTFKGEITVSSSYNIPGVLFIATSGNQNPLIRATYLDIDDGTGRPCQNSVDPDAWAQVQVQTTIFIVPTQVLVTRNDISDNGDNDGWADPGETIEMAVEVSNKGNFDVTGIVVRLSSNDPDVACITVPTIAFGDLARQETRFSEDKFQFLISPDANRDTVFEEVTAVLNLSIDGNEFASPLIPAEIVLDLDLDATGGGSPTTFFESFDGGFGQFTTMHIDEDLNPPDSDLANRPAGVINADGHRCQYADPEWSGSASFGNSQGEQCFPNPNGAPDAYYFHITEDRSFSGTSSLAYNIFLDAARGFTLANSQIDAISTTNPTNLGYKKVCSDNRLINCVSDGDCGGTCQNAKPVVKFKHQISLLDHRSVNAQLNRTADRGIVSVQLADNVGAPQSVWIKAQPFLNVYDAQANSNYFNCSFDPTDDGNDEGDFFDPTDPIRSQGPSSTCSPGFMFAHQGDTDQPFNALDIGDASDGPGLPGAVGIGTWVEPQVDISRFIGQRVRVRFLETGLKLGGAVNWEQAFNFNPDPGDDGWFIDDVEIIDAITDPPAALVIDDNLGTGDLPVCSDAEFQCGNDTGVVLNVVARGRETGPPLDPENTTRNPGQKVVLDASGSTVDKCPDGVLEYQFWLENTGNTVFDGAPDQILQAWSLEDKYSDTPEGDTNYGVQARCSSDRACDRSVAIPITVGCSTSGNPLEISNDKRFLDRSADDRRDILLDGTVIPGGKDCTIYWSTGATVDLARGSLNDLRNNGNFTGAATCVLDDYSGLPTSAAEAGAGLVPNAGDGLWYMMRSAVKCNEPGAGGSYGMVGEKDISPAPGREALTTGPCNN